MPKLELLLAAGEASRAIMIGGTLLACLLAGASLWLGLRRRGGEPALLTPPVRPATDPAPPGAQDPAPTGAAATAADAAEGLRSAFHAWLAEFDDLAEPWAAFDQLLREVLARELGASRVRCFQVRAGSETLQRLGPAAPAPEPGGPSVRTGVLGHVVLTGREYAAAEAAHNPLLQTLAQADAEHWDWAWPVRSGNETIGVVAVAHPTPAGVRTPAQRQALGQMISLCWQHVDARLHLRVVCRTDQATGVLTRNDFFTRGAHALDESYRCNEPAVVAVLALEGLRRLDDAGRWHARDALVERIGRSLLRRVRSDDVVGRFADDRFALLLRRLDTGLGRLIAEKLLEGAAACLADVFTADAGPAPRVRIGLVGSGAARPGFAALLTGALAAVESARRADRALWTDLDEGRARPGREATP